jgi:hypothetical protein
LPLNTVIGNLTPRRVFDLFPPLLNEERGKIFVRGADAPLKHPGIINPEQGESKRGEASRFVYREI